VFPEGKRRGARQNLPPLITRQIASGDHTAGESRRLLSDRIARRLGHEHDRPGNPTAQSAVPDSSRDPQPSRCRPSKGRLDIRPDGRGLHCALGDFHIDPWRPVDTAIVTHAHADHARAGSKRYFAAPDCIDLLRIRLGQNVVIEPIPYGETLRLGDVDVSLHPAGHILGSCQVRVTDERETWVFTGDFKRAPDPTCRPFEPVACDVLITEATFALPIYRWPDGGAVAGEILAWWDRNRAAGRQSILLCYALGKAQRILAELARIAPERRAWLHGAMVPLTNAYRDAGVEMLEARPVSEALDAQQPDRDAPTSKRSKRATFPHRDDLVLAPPSAAGTTWVRRFQPYALAFASGWMRVRGDRRRRNIETGFVLSDHADWHDLLQTALGSGARRVLATHGQSDTLCRYLVEAHGIDATELKTAYEGEAGSGDGGEKETA
jgi:putative mRNA 3-end processing factor